MWKLTISSIRAQKARFFLTSVAVILGVAFMAGTLVLTDTIKQSYDNLAGATYDQTDAVVQSAHHVKDDQGKEVRGSVDAALVSRIAAVPGVQSAEAEVRGVAQVVGKDGKLLENGANRPVPIALGWQADPRLNPMDLVKGHAPSASEIVIDVTSADKGKLAIGDTVTVVDKAGSQQYSLAGIAKYAGQDDAAGAQVVSFAPDTAAAVLGEPGRYDAVGVVASPGVSQSEVAANIGKAIGSRDVEVLTGTQATEQARQASGASLGFLNTFLLTIGIVALLVGSFVIYNTFSITVAQRTRNVALLRAIGAKRKQVMRSLVLESVFVGLFASAIGVVAGIGMAKGIAEVFTVFGFELPPGGTVVTPSTIQTSVIVGTVVTVLAAYLPARKAGKVAPIAALRDVAVDRTGTSRRRVVLGAVMTSGGAALLYAGLTGAGFPFVALGALVVFVGVAVLGPVIARPVTRLLGVPLPKLRGMSGTIARQNATRNPRRTSATASALMVGVGLVVLMTVFAASAKSSVGKSIDHTVRSDWVVETAWGMGGLSPQATARIDALPETGSVSPLRFTPAQVGGSSNNLLAFDPTNKNGLDLHALDGDLTHLSPTGIAVWKSTADQKHLAVGDSVPVTFADTGTRTFTVEAIYNEQGPTNGYAISLAAFDANVSDVVDNYLAVNNAPGVSSTDARAAIESVLRDYPNASVKTQEEFKGTLAGRIDRMLNLVYVLLFMALTIALFGIANTLALSVFERTREIGLLRAVGMSRKQLRQSIRWESVLIALLGTTLGAVIGLGFAWAIVESMKDKGIDTLTIPTAQLVWVVVVTAVAAVVAAALPARRAARMDVLEAISE
ncbi:MAG: ABC transporter permease [Acidimicrobiia bacterium]